MVCMELRDDAIEEVNISSVCWSSMQIPAMRSKSMWSGGSVMMWLCCGCHLVGAAFLGCDLLWGLDIVSGGSLFLYQGCGPSKTAIGVSGVANLVKESVTEDFQEGSVIHSNSEVLIA